MLLREAGRHFTDSLDMDHVALDEAHEFVEWATLAALDGQLLVACDVELKVSPYTISADHERSEDGSLSFANYGVTDAGFGRQWFLNEHVAYLEYEVTKRIVWDPTGLENIGTREDSALELKRGDLEPIANANARV